MRNAWKVIIVLLLASAVIAVVSLKRAERRNQQISVKTEPVVFVVSEANQPAKTSKAPSTPLTMNIEVIDSKNLPLLVDLGADKCIPCKMMAPMLEELSEEYKGKLRVVFIDVWKKPREGSKYNVRVIPTQIFIDPDSKELFRHEGFFSKESILTKWKELGFDFEKEQ